MRAALAPSLLARLQDKRIQLIVTANQRLARQVRETVSSTYMVSNATAWRAPIIMPWSAWLQDCYRQFCVKHSSQSLAKSFLLGAHQTDALWSQIVSAELAKSDATFFGKAALVGEVSRAFGLLQRWQLEDEVISAEAHDEDARFFVNCLAALRSAQQASGWLLSEELPAQLLPFMSALCIDADGATLFAGFSEIYPSQRMLLAAMGPAAQIWAPDDAGELPDATLISAPSDDDALVAAGAWAATVREDAPDARIAIVVPDLSDSLEKTRRLITDGLLPGHQFYSDTSRAHLPVAVSLGRPLFEVPAMRAAMMLLRFAANGGKFSQLSLLLRNALLGNGSNASGVELKLRRIPDRHWRPSSLSRWLSDTDQEAPQWLKAILAREWGEHTRKLLPSQWAAEFDGLWNDAGWLQSLTLDSQTYQLRDAIYDSLNSLADLDAVISSCALKVAIDTLERIAQKTIYQPEDTKQSVLIAGPLETVGLHFDAIWIAGLDQQSWPPTGRPSALLPRSVQRRFAMPDATPALVNEFWRKQLRRNVSSASVVALGFSRSRDDTNLQPVLMLQDFNIIRRKELAAVEPSLQRFLCQLKIKETPAQLAPLSADRREFGGHGLLSDQLTDPLTAVIKHRWRCQLLEEPSTGVNAALRGTLLHRALERLYADKPDTARLQAEFVTNAEQLINRAVQDTFKSLFIHADDLLAQLLRLEERRAETLVNRVFESDLQRPAFSIAMIEEKRVLSFSAISLDLRVDRVDVVNKQMLIIDYKSGNLGTLCKVDNLEDKHMQLVAYALLFERSALAGMALVPVSFSPVSALAWLDEDNAQWSRSAKISKLADLPSLVTQWRERCEQLANQFASGDLRINPNIPMANRIPLLAISRVNAGLEDV